MSIVLRIDFDGSFAVMSKFNNFVPCTLENLKLKRYSFILKSRNINKNLQVAFENRVISEVEIIK